MSSQREASAVAVARRRANGGGTIEATFFPSGSDRLQGVVECPAAEVTAGVVICSPLKAELMQNYRRELALSELLAARGLAALRFHYRGAGNSSGEEAEQTLDSLAEDVAAATRYLRQRHGVQRVGLVATRLAALAAARAARDEPTAPLVMWEPVTKPDRYFREVFRYRLISDLKRGNDQTQASTKALHEELERTGRTEVAGFPIYRDLHASCGRRTLVGEIGDGAHPVLVLQVSRAAALRKEYDRLVGKLTAAGHAAQAELVRGEIAWWFQGGAGEDSSGAMNQVTADWLAGQLLAARSDER